MKVKRERGDGDERDIRELVASGKVCVREKGRENSTDRISLFSQLVDCGSL